MGDDGIDRTADFQRQLVASGRARTRYAIAAIVVPGLIAATYAYQYLQIAAWRAEEISVKAEVIDVYRRSPEVPPMVTYSYEVDGKKFTERLLALRREDPKSVGASFTVRIHRDRPGQPIDETHLANPEAERYYSLVRNLAVASGFLPFAVLAFIYERRRRFVERQLRRLGRAHG